MVAKLQKQKNPSMNTRPRHEPYNDLAKKEQNESEFIHRRREEK